MHQTKDINDDYMGSGKYLNHAFKKYGISNFIKEILFEFDNANDMRNKEAEIVNEDFLKRKDIYNLKKGGIGGFDYINDNDLSGQKKATEIAASMGGGFKGKKHTEATKTTIRSKLKGRPGIKGFLGKIHTDATKEKMRESAIGKHVGNKNSQFGTCWITNGKENKKIKKEDLKKYIDQGFYIGRII